MGVSGATLGVSGRENGVDKDEGANDLSAKAVTFGVTSGYEVSSSVVSLVDVLLEALHHSSPANGTKTLHHYVEHCPSQRQLPRQEQPERHSRVYVTSCYPTNAVKI